MNKYNHLDLLLNKSMQIDLKVDFCLSLPLKSKRF